MEFDLQILIWNGVYINRRKQTIKIHEETGDVNHIILCNLEIKIATNRRNGSKSSE